MYSISILKQELGSTKTNEYYLFESVIDRHRCHLVAGLISYISLFKYHKQHTDHDSLLIQVRVFTE